MRDIRIHKCNTFPTRDVILYSSTVKSIKRLTESQVYPILSFNAYTRRRCQLGNRRYDEVRE